MEKITIPGVANAIELGSLVTIQMPSNELPLTIHAAPGVNCMEWAAEYKDELNQLLISFGALLLRGFKIEGAPVFNQLFSLICGAPMEYKNRTSPREQVHDNIYTSTSHPNDQYIQMHTENSYSQVYNRIIAFYCLVPAAQGGETPIADERKLLKRLQPETVRKFRERKIKYLRNSIPGIGLDWKTIYQTDDKEVVSKHLNAVGAEYIWADDDHLRVKWILPAFQKHPLTGEEMWFNHMYFGLKSHYDPILLEYFQEDDLPFATYYGDGSEIEASVVQEFKDFYNENSIVFKWETNDFLLLDNMMFSHGRKPFKGNRTILTAMAQPFTISA
ncbi:TauD/TfdA family dioxygenase [Mucilaginibacter sp. UC70_90]